MIGYTLVYMIVASGEDAELVHPGLSCQLLLACLILCRGLVSASEAIWLISVPSVAIPAPTVLPPAIVIARHHHNSVHPDIGIPLPQILILVASVSYCPLHPCRLRNNRRMVTLQH
jgi:hypothetical protein